MTLLSERIPEFYQEHFDEEMPGASSFQQLREDLNDNGEAVANNASSGAILNLSQNYDIDAEGKGDKIREHVREQLSLLVESGSYAKEIKFITEEAYKQKGALQIFEENISVEEAVNAFNDELWTEVRELNNTRPLDTVLEEVGEKFTDTRPVMIFEDFAITAMEAERLASYMERDKPTDNWDFIVAGTRDSTEVLHTRTAEDRFEFYRTNEQNSNSVLFLNEDSAVDFIRPYLAYFKSFDGSVEYDRSGGGLDLELKPAKQGSLCAECGFCDESFRDLFPFNEPFLERVYAGLDEEEKSPREYVMVVFDILEQYYEGYIDAPSDADVLVPLENPVDPAPEVWDRAERVGNLGRWYGTPESTSGEIVVDRRFADVFGLEETDTVTFGASEVRVPTEEMDGLGGDNGGDDGGDDGNDDGGDDGGEGVDPAKVRAKEKYDELSSNVRAWQSNPSNFTEISQYIRRGLTKAFEHITDNYRLFDNSGLRYNLSSQKDPFVFSSMTAYPDDDQIGIDPEGFWQTDLKTLLKFGIFYEEYRPGADIVPILDSMGTQLTGYGRQWRRKVIDDNLRSEFRLFKQSSNCGFEDFALAGYAFVVLLDSPFDDLTAATLSERFDEGKPYSLDTELNTALKEELDKDSRKTLSDFMKYAEQFEDLFSAFFGATQSTVDVRAVRQRMNERSPLSIIEDLAKTKIDDISARVRFDTNNKFRDIAKTAYYLESTLESLEGESRDDVLGTFTDVLADVSINDLEALVTTLETYEDANQEMIESLKKFTRLSQSDVDDAVAAAERAHSMLIRGVEQERLQAILISQKLSADDVYKRFNDLTIVRSGGSGSDAGFGERFNEVSTYYVE
jgi:hypothetical protein